MQPVSLPWFGSQSTHAADNGQPTDDRTSPEACDPQPGTSPHAQPLEIKLTAGRATVPEPLLAALGASKRAIRRRRSISVGVSGAWPRDSSRALGTLERVRQ
eukprot:364728-Chlamydomonas_euryale.AAC.5